MGMDKLKWNFHSLDQLHYAVNSTLRYAMQNERCKRWSKVGYRIVIHVYYGHKYIIHMYIDM